MAAADSTSSFTIEELKERHTFEVLAMLDDPHPSAFNYFSISDMLNDVTLIPYGLRDESTRLLIAVIVVAPWARDYLCREIRSAPDVKVLLRNYGKVAYVALLCVRGGYRRLGYGRRLISHAINEIRDLPTAEPRMVFALVPCAHSAAVSAFGRMGTARRPLLIDQLAIAALFPVPMLH